MGLEFHKWQGETYDNVFGLETMNILAILQTFIINKQSRDLLTLAKNLINKLEINQIIIIIIISCVLNRD